MSLVLPQILSLIANNPKWIKIATKSRTDFSTAGLVNTIASGYTLPAKCVIQATLVVPTTTFSGGTIASYVISVGVGSGASVAKYAAATNVFTGATLPAPLAQIGVESMSVGTSITLTATSTIGLLSAATQGSVDIYCLVGLLP